MSFDAAWLARNGNRVLSVIGGGDPSRPVRTTQGTSEEAVQRRVIEWRDRTLVERPALRLLFHPANGEKRSRATGGRLKAMGVVPGVPDLLLLHPSGPFHGLGLELKALGGDLSAAQARVLLDLHAAGYAVTVCWSPETAISAIVEYLDDPSAFLSGL